MQMVNGLITVIESAIRLSCCYCDYLLFFCQVRLIINRITKREKEIVEQICQGKTNQQIADALFISLQTVKDHTHRIYCKIGINSRMNLVQMVNG
jgi:ATP/maltotriose-dependent transcriptional regulator MalT